MKSSVKRVLEKMKVYIKVFKKNHTAPAFVQCHEISELSNQTPGSLELQILTTCSISIFDFIISPFRHPKAKENSTKLHIHSTKQPRRHVNLRFDAMSAVHNYFSKLN